MNTLLLSSALGIFWLVLLFAICFFAVHLCKLARWGQRYRKAQKGETNENPLPTPPKQETPERDTSQEPIYYIVERKKRTKSSFSTPKQIRFK